MMIKCKQAVDYISKKEEGKLGLYQRFELVLHLAICKYCKRFYRQNKLLASIFDKSAHQSNINLGADEKEAIIKGVQDADEDSIS